MVDIHCHILPLDDGARDYVQAIAMARMAQANGTTDIVATPHFDINREKLGEFIKTRDKATVSFRELFSDADVGINVYAAAELMLHPFIVDLPLDSFTIGNRYLLVELPHTTPPHWLMDIIFGLQIKGFVPILAHPERSNELIKDFEELELMVARGLLLQVNSTSITAKGTEYKHVCKLIENGLVCTIASDAHSINKRNPSLSEAYDILIKRYGLEYARKLQQNAVDILTGATPKPALPPSRGIINRLIKGAR